MDKTPQGSAGGGPLQVRRAEVADATALAALLEAFLVEEGKRPEAPVDAAALARWLAPPAPRFQALIGLAESQALGYLAFYGAFSLFKPGPVLLVENLFVRPQGRGIGLGRRLMAGAAQEARRLGYQRIELHVRDDRPEAGRFYEALGMRHAGEAVYRIEDASLEALTRFERA